MIITFEEFIKQLNQGYVFEFTYMNSEHKIKGFDNKTYTVIKYTQDTYSNREETKIVGGKIVKEMFKSMYNITYTY